MKKNNTLKVLLITILFTYLLTWLLPITYFNSGLYTDVRYPAGLFDIFNYPTLTFYYFGQLAIYVLSIGAFYGVFNQTGVFRKVVDKLVNLFKGKSIIFFGAVILLLSVIVAFCGFSYELFFVLPFLAAIILSMGYDRMTVALTLVGSIAVGFIGSLFAQNITGQYMNTMATTYTDLIWYRVAILVIGIVVLTFNVIRHTKKIDDTVKEDNKEYIPLKVELKSKKGKVRASWPGIVVFDLILILMIMGTLDYSGAFNLNIFATMHENIMSFTIKDYAIFSKVLGSTLQNSQLGNWTSVEFTTVMILATLLLSLIYRIKLSDMFDNVKEGAKKFALSALLMLLAYTVLITTSNHPIVLTILKPLLEITKGFNSITLSISMLIASIFNVDAFYTASAMMPYVASLIEDVTVYPLVVLISQAMQGLALLIAPTSIVLLGVISYLKVPYTKWFKKVIAFFLEMFLIAFVLFSIILLLI